MTLIGGPEPEERYFRSETLRNKGSGETDSSGSAADSGFSEVAVNASLAFIDGAKPRDELETALVRMACTQSATMALLRERDFLLRN